MEMKTLGAALALTFAAASLVAFVGAQPVNDDNFKEVPVGYDEVTPTPREVGQSCNAYSLCKSGLCCLQSDLSSPITTCQPRSAPGQRCTGVQVESPFYLDYCPCLKGDRLFFSPHC
ncbi:secreted salivary gland peptide, putative [Ixodes scapularis]|uniref:Secreted salivary gland peptide, putative n=1 Tax=Ixodes scapularis TaxID=6945 RepID=B7Q5I8_IXOSC|nr:secreted salivary gland peptide, putative [Ixodes scapularis]|eukprot:XP_002401976.1 secreted salivary gland peptide, putative [Ixodes scapularis]